MRTGVGPAARVRGRCSSKTPVPPFPDELAARPLHRFPARGQDVHDQPLAGEGVVADQVALAGAGPAVTAPWPPPSRWSQDVPLFRHPGPQRGAGGVPGAHDHWGPGGDSGLRAASGSAVPTVAAEGRIGGQCPGSRSRSRISSRSHPFCSRVRYSPVKAALEGSMPHFPVRRRARKVLVWPKKRVRRTGPAPRHVSRARW